MTLFFSILSDARKMHHIAESAQLAEVLFNSMAKMLKPSGRGVKQAPFTVLHGTNMPAVLVEVGYVTNPQDAKMLSQRSHLKRIAGAISRGIVQFARRKVLPVG